MEVHLVVAASGALFLDGRLLGLVVVAYGSGCVDELTLLTECGRKCRRMGASDDGEVVVNCAMVAIQASSRQEMRSVLVLHGL